MTTNELADFLQVRANADGEDEERIEKFRRAAACIRAAAELYYAAEYLKDIGNDRLASALAALEKYLPQEPTE